MLHFAADLKVIPTSLWSEGRHASGAISSTLCLDRVVLQQWNGRHAWFHELNKWRARRDCLGESQDFTKHQSDATVSLGILTQRAAESSWTSDATAEAASGRARMDIARDIDSIC